MKITITYSDGQTITVEGVNFDDVFSNLRTEVLKLVEGEVSDLTLSIPAPESESDGDSS